MSAPRGQPAAVRSNDVVEVGLRNKFGSPGESYSVLVRVIDPKGTGFTTTARVEGDTWAYVNYPSDFPSASPVYPGVYTVVWEVKDGFIACDGFEVKGY